MCLVQQIFASMNFHKMPPTFQQNFSKANSRQCKLSQNATEILAKCGLTQQNVGELSPERDAKWQGNWPMDEVSQNSFALLFHNTIDLCTPKSNLSLRESSMRRTWKCKGKLPAGNLSLRESSMRRTWKCKGKLPAAWISDEQVGGLKETLLHYESTQQATFTLSPAFF